MPNVADANSQWQCANQAASDRPSLRAMMRWGSARFGIMRSHSDATMCIYYGIETIRGDCTLLRVIKYSARVVCREGIVEKTADVGRSDLPWPISIGRG